MRQQLRAMALGMVLTAALFFPKDGQSQDLKIAVVDVETLTLASDEGKVAAEKLKKKYDEFSAIMDKARKEIDDKETRLRNTGRALSQTAQAQLSREITDDKTVFDRKNQDYQKQMADYQDELLAPIADKAKMALGSYVSEKGFNLVIDLSADMGNVVWANAGNNITADVVKILNDQYKRSGGTPPAAAAPSPAPTRTPAATPPASTTPRPPAASTPAAPATKQ